MKTIRNSESPRGRRYQICLTNPRKGMETALLEPSPHQKGLWWVIAQGWGKARSIKIIEDLRKATDADECQLFPMRDGGEEIAVVTREEVIA